MNRVSQNKINFMLLLSNTLYVSKTAHPNWGYIKVIEKKYNLIKCFYMNIKSDKTKNDKIQDVCWNAVLY